MTQSIDLFPATAAFAASAVVVWWAGSRLPRHVLALVSKTGMGEGFAAMLVLGGITSLPELTTATSAAAMGAPLLAFNNVLGSASFNLLLLALADVFLGTRALTSVVARPVTLTQGVLGMLTMAAVCSAIVLDQDYALGPVGATSVAIFGLSILAIAIANRAERRPMWTVVNPSQSDTSPPEEYAAVSWPRLLAGLVGCAMLVLAGGVALAASAAAIADQTGLSGNIVGFLFAAMATSLPELSAIVGSIRVKRYELAVGEVFGSNLIALSLVFFIDLAAPGPPVFQRTGSFEALAALLALIMSGVFVLGLIERRDRTVLRMGEDSLAAIIVYALGTAWLLKLAIG